MLTILSGSLEVVSPILYGQVPGQPVWAGGLYLDLLLPSPSRRHRILRFGICHGGASVERSERSWRASNSSTAESSARSTRPVPTVTRTGTPNRGLASMFHLER